MSRSFARRVEIGFGIFFISMAALTIVYRVTNPAMYDHFADTAALPFYKDFWQATVRPNLAFFLLASVIFELVIGILLQGKPRWATTGLVGAVLFCTLILPFNTYTLLNIPLIGVLVWLMIRKFGYPRPIPAL